ncbi:hypothetical protein CJF42_06005 [Pseudoalteromonas sp. NBT06-2]|uniref:hypothetical protein n=1 Tax=Pseudoalteromonas sp. NBT06-2 TaxID=2025950 RepID=UPI000BA5CC38|nr:hypothetical protein [Pseudoalteromonas sp. NBT06-2]PAJ75203.1 hypothetical protein CJF42_06005 [Pseudoalteromonas sp. NBT06-2]
MRSLLLKFGVVIDKSYKTFKATLTALLDEGIHAAITHMLRDAIDELTSLDKKLKRVEREFIHYNDQSFSAKVKLPPAEPVAYLITPSKG